MTLHPHPTRLGAQARTAPAHRRQHLSSATRGLIEGLERRVLMSTYTWTGASTASDNWSDSANWAGGVGPQISERDVVVVFNTTDALSVNDISFLHLNQIRFDPGSNVTLGIKNSFTLQDDPTASLPEVVVASGQNTITSVGSGQFLFDTTSPTVAHPKGDFNFVVPAGLTLDISAQMKGLVSVIKDGAGTLRLSGSKDNLYTGFTSVRDGTLLLAKDSGATAIPGSFASPVDLTPDPAGSGSVLLRLDGPGQFTSIPEFSMTGNSTLDLNGFDHRVSQITLVSVDGASPRITTGAATLSSSEIITSVAPGATNITPPTISGKIGASVVSLTAEVADGPAPVDLVIDAAIVYGRLDKNFAGTLSLEGSASNTTTGGATVNAGTLLLNKSGGATAVSGDIFRINGSGGNNPSPTTALVTLVSGDQIADTTAVWVSTGGRFDVNGKSEKVAGLGGSWYGIIDLTNPASHLTVGVNGATWAGGNYIGLIIGSGTLTKTGDRAILTFSKPMVNDVKFEVLEGTLWAHGGQTWGSLDMRSGTLARFFLDDDPSVPPVLHLRSLSVAPGATLTLEDGALVVDYDAGQSPAAAVRASLASAYATGDWSGAGIKPATLTSGDGQVAAVGVMENDPAAGGPGLTEFMGQPIDATSLILRDTVAGDANLDGSVGPGDFNLLATNFGRTGGDWLAGDLNFDGAVGPGDFNLLASQFGSALPSPTPTPSVQAGVADQVLSDTSRPPPLARQQRRRGAPGPCRCGGECGSGGQQSAETFELT